MPFAVHPITPTAMSKAVVPDNIGNEFDCVANHTLAQAMRQMVSLLKQADDIFGGLESQCAAINDATKNIVKRVSHIEVIVNKMDAKNEKIRECVGNILIASKTYFQHLEIWPLLANCRLTSSMSTRQTKSSSHKTTDHMQ